LVGCLQFYVPLKYFSLTITGEGLSQQVWHDKDPSLQKGPERRAKALILQPFTGNGDVSI
jgi:hypothetical protein